MFNFIRKKISQQRQTKRSKNTGFFFQKKVVMSRLEKQKRGVWVVVFSQRFISCRGGWWRFFGMFGGGGGSRLASCGWLTFCCTGWEDWHFPLFQINSHCNRAGRYCGQRRRLLKLLNLDFYGWNTFSDVCLRSLSLIRFSAVAQTGSLRSAPRRRWR